jgi:endosialidase-like protein
VWSTGSPNNTSWTSQFRISGDSGNVAMAYNGGFVGIGTPAPMEKLHVAGAFIRIDGAGDEQAYIGGDAVANDVQIGSMRNGISRVALWNTGSATRMDLFCRNINCGDISAGNISGNWVSDARLKKDIAPIEDALDLVKLMRGVSFRWNDERRKGAEDFGVIAQELQPVLPQLVHHGETSLGVSYISLIPILIEAVKELASEVDALRAAAGKGTRPDKAGKPARPEPSAKASAGKKGKGAKGA